MPLVMLSTPEATPDCPWGTEPMMAALFGGVKQSQPDPTDAQEE